MLFFVLAYQNHIYTQTAHSWHVIEAGSVKLETHHILNSASFKYLYGLGKL